MYADGPCKDVTLSQRRLSIQFIPCSCPIGFQTTNTERTRCECKCDSAVEEYITECDPKTETLVRKGNFWISYINATDKSSEYKCLIYPYCPLDWQRGTWNGME